MIAASDIHRLDIGTRAAIWRAAVSVSSGVISKSPELKCIRIGAFLTYRAFARAA